MASEWEEMAVEDIAAPVPNALVGGPFGSNLVSSDYVDNGVPVIRGRNMGGRWVSGDFVYVTTDKATSLRANLASQGDIVFTQRGTLGQVSLVPAEPFERYLVSQSQMKLTINREIAAPLFFYYVFSSHEQQDYVRQHAIQTGVPHTNLGILRNTPVLVPPLPEQRAIAHILGTMDDKIDLNRRMNETLEAIARAIFKSWFVDFDPVRAKAESREPNLPRHIADLFPDRFEDSQLGEVPEGWGVFSLDEIANYQNGLALQKYPAGGGEEFFYRLKIRELRQGYFDDRSERSRTEIPENCIVYDGDVIFSWSGSLLIDIWTGGTAALNQHLFKVTSDSYPRWFYYFWTKHHLEEFQRIAAGKATTMGHIKRQHLSEAKAVVPSKDLIEKCTEYLAPFLLSMVNSRIECQTLGEIRDTLLAVLISGELHLTDPEKFSFRDGL